MKRFLLALLLLLSVPAFAQVRDDVQQPGENPRFRDFTGQSSAPASPGTGKFRVYMDASGNLMKKNSAGTVTAIGATPGGSPNQLQYNNNGAFGGMSGTAWTPASSPNFTFTSQAGTDTLAKFKNVNAGTPSVGLVSFDSEQRNIAINDSGGNLVGFFGRESGNGLNIEGWTAAGVTINAHAGANRPIKFQQNATEILRFISTGIQLQDGLGLLDANGNTQIAFTKTASAVNYLNVTNAASGNSPTLSAAGAGTNLDINLSPKGTGVVKVGSNISLDGSNNRIIVYNLRVPYSGNPAVTYTDINTDVNGYVNFAKVSINTALGQGQGKFQIDGTSTTVPARIASDAILGWQNSTNAGSGSTDVGYGRYAAGKGEINNGTLIGTTASNARDLLHRRSYLVETSTNPSASDLTIAGSNTKDVVSAYMTNDKLVFAYNNGGTVTYLSIPLDGSTTTWTHSTSAP